MTQLVVGRWIDWKALHDGGFEGVVFDKDNTLTAPHALAVWPALSTSLQECQSVFEGRIALLSNSAGTLVTVLSEQNYYCCDTDLVLHSVVNDSMMLCHIILKHNELMTRKDSMKVVGVSFIH